MRDTPIEFQELMQRRIMERSAIDRLRMCCDMHDTAKRIVEASLPELSGLALKIAVFDRFYGHDFDDETKKRIKEHIIHVNST